MNKLLLLSSGAILSGLLSVSAGEFPLKFKTIEAKEVMSYPGGYGCYAQLTLTKPTGITKEPPASSKYPLYGELGRGSGKKTFLFRIDESKDGKGYDSLIVDLNQNGDLADDVATARVTLPAGARQVSGPFYPFFGPMEAPADKVIAGGKPNYYAQAYINQGFRDRPQTQGQYIGQLRFRAGWYLETTVELEGIKQKVGLYDGDANLCLGDISSPKTYGGSGEEENWYFSSADNFLMDVNGSGSFENDSFGRESAPYGPILYFGSKAFKVAVAKDWTTMQVDAWSDPLAEVTLQPQGEQVGDVTMAWEQKPDQWQLVQAGVLNGKVRIPPGNYRLYGCTLSTKTAQGELIAAQGSLRSSKKLFTYEVAKANALQCGAPLDIKVETTKRKPESYEESRLPAVDSNRDSEFILAINATVVGRGGEVYSTYGKGAKLTNNPDQPTFTIQNDKGEKIANGSLEFG